MNRPVDTTRPATSNVVLHLAQLHVTNPDAANRIANELAVDAAANPMSPTEPISAQDPFPNTSEVSDTTQDDMQVSASVEYLFGGAAASVLQVSANANLENLEADLTLILSDDKTVIDTNVAYQTPDKALAFKVNYTNQQGHRVNGLIKFNDLAQAGFQIGPDGTAYSVAAGPDIAQAGITVDEDGLVAGTIRSETQSSEASVTLDGETLQYALQVTGGDTEGQNSVGPGTSITAYTEGILGGQQDQFSIGSTGTVKLGPSTDLYGGIQYDWVPELNTFARTVTAGARALTPDNGHDMQIALALDFGHTQVTREAPEQPDRLTATEVMAFYSVFAQQGDETSLEVRVADNDNNEIDHNGTFITRNEADQQLLQHLVQAGLPLEGLPVSTDGSHFLIRTNDSNILLQRQPDLPEEPITLKEPE